MKKSDIYEIAIRIIGIYILAASIVPVFSFAFSFVPIFIVDSYGNGPGKMAYVYTILSGLLFAIVVFVFIRLLIIKNRRIAKWICTAPDYEENASLFAERKTIYEISLFITGLAMIAWQLPPFISDLIDYIKKVQGVSVTFIPSPKYIITEILRIVVGVVIVYYSKSLSSLLAKEKPVNNEPF